MQNYTYQINVLKLYLSHSNSSSRYMWIYVSSVLGWFDSAMFSHDVRDTKVGDKLILFNRLEKIMGKKRKLW